MKSATLLACVLLTLTGCTAFGPKYEEKPVTDLLQDATIVDDTSATALSQVPAPAVDKWWDRFGDANLTRLIQQAFSNNHSLEQARANLASSRAAYEYQKGGLFPSVNAGGTVTRSATSKNGSQRGAKFTDYNLAFDATWELDFFGRQKFLMNAAEAESQAAEASLKSVWISVASEVALRYLELRTLQARLAVAQDNIDTQKETYDLLADRYDSGVGDALAKYQAEYNLRSTEAAVPQILASIENTKNALAILCGVTPGTLPAEIVNAPQPPPPPEPTAEEQAKDEQAKDDQSKRARTLRPSNIPQPEILDLDDGIPANALSQRPDVIIAERSLKASVDTLGSAKAERFPRIFISGNLGLDSLTLGDLFDWDSHFYSFGPGISIPLFRGGQIVANIEIKSQAQRAAAADYYETVLNAYSDVRNALSDYRNQQDRLASLRLAVEASINAYDAAYDKYKNGLTDFNNVLDAQRNMLSLDEARVISEGAIAEAQVKLYKALCGGWDKADRKDDELAQYFFGEKETTPLLAGIEEDVDISRPTDPTSVE